MHGMEKLVVFGVSGIEKEVGGVSLWKEEVSALNLLHEYIIYVDGDDCEEDENERCWWCMLINYNNWIVSLKRDSPQYLINYIKYTTLNLKKNNIYIIFKFDFYSYA